MSDKPIDGSRRSVPANTTMAGAALPTLGFAGPAPGNTDASRSRVACAAQRPPCH